ncbi:hypothetical protein TUM20983_37320 [Mycobacterium antarcticum]|uniref:TetR/AcrR family transcriptional regulator n=1 Tax=Mycolicibacterium sp. TUM20983 TaxID=3023369 RepID=UPI002385AC12|nr:TetR/AcrR family transcriptional regulator [Mycolicibacterium sp. TUM20983]GLP76622.1 hypothetical protein TUM20983_37320 [Mycolicibacterium sp. TUM20983]
MTDIDRAAPVITASSASPTGSGPMTDAQRSSTTRRAGRPTISAQRRQQIVHAFIGLLGERGLAGVTLDDVARAAGIQRAALRHFVGNRQDLVAATIEELSRRHASTVRELIAESPSIDDLISALFSNEWVTDMRAEDAAFDVLMQEGTRDAATRGFIRAAYDVLLTEIAAALRRGSQRPGTDIDNVAYAIACLSEHNIVMQQIGYPPEMIRGARAAAHTLAQSVLMADDQEIREQDQA